MLARFFSLLLLACAANADTITFNFTGTVTQVPTDDVFGDIAFQDAISGSFTFDSAALDLVPGASTGSYSFSDPFGLSVQIGSHLFSATGNLNISVLNGFVDQYTVLAESPDGLSIDMIFQDSTGTVFSSDALPLIEPSLSAFDQRDFHLVGEFDAGEVQIDGQITSLGAASTPEPAAAAFVGIGIALMFYRIRKK